jgi:hypothetical protein
MSDQTTEQAAPQLQIADLLLTAQLIQLVTQRGAFKAEELEQVGGLYNRVVAFLQASGALTPVDAPAGTTAPATPDTPAQAPADATAPATADATAPVTQ